MTEPDVLPYPGPDVGVRVEVVSFEYDDVPDSYPYPDEQLLAVVRSADDIERLGLPSRIAGHTGLLDWNGFTLHGPDEPYMTMPDIDVVYIVNAGGIGDRFGDTGLNHVCLGVFTDEASARAYADSTRDPMVDVRTVPVGVLLPIQE